MNLPLEWLLEGEPYIEYHTRRDLLGQPADNPRVITARSAMLAQPLVAGLVAELANWPGQVISSHKSAGQSFHKLTFLAELGLTAADPGVDTVIAAVKRLQSPEGPFQLVTQIPVHFGGSGQEQRAWALCDAPLSVYALAKFGLQNDPAVRAAMDYLTALVRDNGWPCAVSKELGNFHGPGNRKEPCPYATLAMLKALTAFDDLRDSPAARVGAESLLHLWSESLTQHPYIFYMGNDFRKLKVPLVWYDLVHVLDVLSQFAWLRGDPRLGDMLGVLKKKMDTNGRFTVESVWMAWKEWEFGQKKTPSRWLTLTAWKIMKRIEEF